MKKIDQLGLSEKDYKYLRLVNILNNQIRKRFMFPVFAYHFGIANAMELYKSRKDRMKYLDTCYEIVCSKMTDFIHEYKYAEQKSESNLNNVIWVCWLQKEMPEVVKMCINSMVINKPNDAEVVIISSDNIKEYVDIPSFIYKRLKRGQISLTHFSDILRFSLLSKYGGLWIDSTVFVSDVIPETYVRAKLYSIRQKKDINENFYYGKLTSFLIGGDKNCGLFDFCYKFFLEYQKKVGYLVDIHLINVCYRIAYEHIDSLKVQIDSIEPNNYGVEDLIEHVNEIYNEDTYAQLTNNQIFHKLNWRRNYIKETKEGETLYGHLHRKQSADLYKKYKP